MAARKAADVSVDESIAKTEEQEAPAAAPAPDEVAKGELTGSVMKGGVEYPAGTKASELDLSKDERERLDRLGLIA